MGLQGVLDKPFGGFVRHIVVAQRQKAAAGAQLPLLAGGGGASILQNQQAAVVTGAADGQRLIIGKIPVHLIIRADVGGLGGAVQVGEPGRRVMGTPVVQLGGGHDLPRKQNGVQRGRRGVVQRLPVCHDAQRGRHPIQRVDVLFCQVIQQLHRKAEQPFWHHLHAGTGAQRGKNIGDGHTKVEGRLVAEHGLLGDGEGLRRPCGVGQHRPVGHRHPLGCAGGPGGEQHISKVSVDGGGTHRSQRGGIHRGGRQFLEQQQLCTGVQSLRGLPVSLIGEQHRRAKLVGDGPHPCGGLGGVQNSVKAARRHDAQHGMDAGGLVVQIQRHRASLHPHAAQAAADGRRDGSGLRPCMNTVFIAVGEPVRPACRRALQQFQKVFQSVLLFLFRRLHFLYYSISRCKTGSITQKVHKCFKKTRAPRF